MPCFDVLNEAGFRCASTAGWLRSHPTAFSAQGNPAVSYKGCYKWVKCPTFTTGNGATEKRSLLFPSPSPKGYCIKLLHRQSMIIWCFGQSYEKVFFAVVQVTTAALSFCPDQSLRTPGHSDPLLPVPSTALTPHRHSRDEHQSRVRSHIFLTRNSVLLTLGIF